LLKRILYYYSAILVEKDLRHQEKKFLEIKIMEMVHHQAELQLSKMAIINYINQILITAFITCRGKI